MKTKSLSKGMLAIVLVASALTFNFASGQSLTSQFSPKIARASALDVTCNCALFNGNANCAANNYGANCAVAGTAVCSNFNANCSGAK